MKHSHTEYLLILLAAAICIGLCFALLVWLFQHIDPNLGGWIK